MFDRVSYFKLIDKVYNIIQNDQLTNWLTNYLSNCTQYVDYSNVSSGKVVICSGVPQRSVLGLLLFLLYINDITCSTDVQMKLFEDYCTIYTTISDEKDQLRLNRALRAIQE